MATLPKEDVLDPHKVVKQDTLDSLILCTAFISLVFTDLLDLTEVHVLIKALFEPDLGVFSVVSEHRSILHENSLIILSILGLMHSLDVLQSLCHLYLVNRFDFFPDCCRYFLILIQDKENKP